MEEDCAAIHQEIEYRIQRQRNIKFQDEKLRARQLSFDQMEINPISEEIQQKDQQQQQQRGDQDQTRKRKHTVCHYFMKDLKCVNRIDFDSSFNNFRK